MAGLQDWSTTAGSNGSIDPNINFAEGQTPASLNNSNRAMMAALRAFYQTLGGGISYGGSGNTYTATNAATGAWTAYAEGLIIGFEPNNTNSGAATLNVDGLGAKSIVKGVSTALASGDLVQGAFYLLRYDGTNFCVIGSAGAGSFQPLDATLTALAALSWSSGNALVQFTAADTVSLTLTPSVSSVTASQGASASTPSGTFVNTADNGNVMALRLEGDRATPAANDVLYVPWYLSDNAGNQDEFARISVRATSVTSGAENGQFRFGVRIAGVLTDVLSLATNTLTPITNDGMGLGTSTLGFADLFGASGFSFNFNNGNVIVAHNNTAALLEVTTGEFAARTPRSSETSGTLTALSRNRVVKCTGGVTMPSAVFTDDDMIVFNPGTSARTFTRGSGLTMYVNGSNVASATLAANQSGGALYDDASTVTLSGAFA